MGQKPNWTAEEVEYLQENWGKSPVGSIREKLNRSKGAVIQKARKTGLARFLDSGEYITYNQLMKVITGYSGNSYAKRSWMTNRKLPVKHKTVNNCRFRIIYLEDFWKWAAENRNFIDFSRLEKNALGKEPRWVESQRNADRLKNSTVKTTPWTKDDDKRLKDMLKTYQYSYDEIAAALHRTVGAVARRVIDLKLKDRPVKADNHRKWTAAEMELAEDMVLMGYGYVIIAQRTGRGQKAVRGYFYRKYGTENIDKVRSCIIKNRAERS